MPTIVYSSLKDKSIFAEDTATFAKEFGVTPKYNAGSDSTETMARFFIPPTLHTAITKNNTKAANDKKILGKLSSEQGGYFSFLLQNVQESYTENVQVSQTISDNYVSYAMGSKPPIFVYSGTLINSQQDDWRRDFLQLYANYLRASKLANYAARGIENVSLLKYDNFFVRGIMLNLSMSMNASNELAVPFSFSYLVKRVHTFSQGKHAISGNEIVDQERVLTTTEDIVTEVTTTNTALKR